MAAAEAKRLVEMVALVEVAKEGNPLDQERQVKVMLVKIQTTPTGLEVVAVLAKLAEQIPAAMVEMAFKTILPALMFTMQEAAAVEKKPQDMRQMAAFPAGMVVAAQAATEQTHQQQMERLILEAEAEVAVLLATGVEVLEDLGLLLLESMAQLAPQQVVRPSPKLVATMYTSLLGRGVLQSNGSVSI